MSAQTDTSTQTDIDAAGLTARLRATEDRLALLDLEGAYGPAYDSKDGVAWADLFTDDGVYQTRQPPGMPTGNLVRGREDLVRFCAEQPASGTHFMHAPQVTLAGDRATGRVHFEYRAFSVDQWRRAHTRRSTGYYDTAYTRTQRGWRIRRRITTFLELTVTTLHPYEPEPADLEGPLPASEGYRDAR